MSEPGVLPTALPPPGFGPWVDPSGRGRWAVRGLVAVLFLLVVDVLWSLLGIAVVGGAYEPASEMWLHHFDSAWAVIGGLYVVAAIGSAVTFIRWQRLVIRNTAFLGCERPSPSPGVATIQWFIPFASVVLPALSLRTIAQWSRPPDRPSAGLLLGWWWGLWVVANGLLGLSGVVQRLVEGTVPWVASTAAEAAATLILIAAGVLAIKVVRTVTAWQLAKADASARGSRSA